MLEKQVTIINKLGLHARAAAKLINTTSQFSSDIKLVKEGREVDGKSIMAVMMLAAAKGTELTVQARGEDAEQALLAIETLIQNRFDEAE
ncbi:HPr family phosphocarrier protein [Marinobacterium arenosum]|uniref:HPr family phosphocarrier protein n=1 Tax=Marinobacterium arenosum TaxID=2862496 RepID=UPI001C9491DA|nr:HPr family phosphocarrier protein [Marinobacterium arenosum]MBY4676756.1 HPr family phosphocarrier protein [Marinobacterium arenosum]